MTSKDGECGDDGLDDGGQDGNGFYGEGELCGGG